MNCVPRWLSLGELSLNTEWDSPSPFRNDKNSNIRANFCKIIHNTWIPCFSYYVGLPDVKQNQAFSFFCTLNGSGPISLPHTTEGGPGPREVFALPVFSALLWCNGCNGRHLGSIIEEKAYFQDHEGRVEEDRLSKWEQVNQNICKQLYSTV